MAAPLPRIDASGSDATKLQRAPESARAKLARWLLSDVVQLSHGAERGGVAGSVDAEGGVEYVYPESTGYYLQWLAWQASRDGPIATLAARAAAAQAWLARWIAPDRVPYTRVYLRTGHADWRNQASFCFDLAMALRGLSSAARLDLIEIDEALVLRLARELVRLVGDDGLFHACVLHEGAQAVPDRWSTRRGGFLAKAAAGVLGATRSLPQLPPALISAAEDSFAASLEWMVRQPHQEAHALLYAMEGVLALPRHHRFAAAIGPVVEQFLDLPSEIERLGWLPEMRGRMGVRRLDIVAQTLRIGTLLAATDIAIEAGMLDRLGRELISCMTPDGTLPFHSAALRPQYCTWTAMFAEQALAWSQAGGTAHSAAGFGPLLV